MSRVDVDMKIIDPLVHLVLGNLKSSMARWLQLQQALFAELFLISTQKSFFLARCCLHLSWHVHCQTAMTKSCRNSVVKLARVPVANLSMVSFDSQKGSNRPQALGFCRHCALTDLDAEICQVLASADSKS
jgi:hypothetical protein